MKLLSVPRLALTAAAMSAWMGEILGKNLLHFFYTVQFYKNSVVILYYVRHTGSRVWTFVTTHVVFIHHLMSVDQ